MCACMGKPINDIELLCVECDRKLFPAKENLAGEEHHCYRLYKVQPCC